ncbi:glycosyltransferase [Coraliomargarita algicola]|uniref:Glycosyltransferase n=1 Tax=Coraliomargarita algicola TaxID=3092156 RepID=A0ABZ0RJU0_9BACT|nr:glycosyltransferase [Coraliomargarita sp. J2-16]WPJ96476.1 glycosyltransferase [Coraliomargarita sp. J2-16]
MDCLIIGKVWPEPSSTAAGRRTHDLITALQLGGWQVHFASAAQRGMYALDLDALNVETHNIAVNDSAFDHWIASLAPELVVFDRFMTEEQFGWRVAQHCPDALRVLDTSDLHCLRMARQQALKSGAALNLRNETALREIASIYRSDLTLMISEYEMELLRREFSIEEELLSYWPFAVTLPESSACFEAREHFILIGSFLHPPNLDAARWCRQSLWPKIRAVLPNAELHCFGSYGERYAGELHAPKEGFHYKGRAEDALETMAKYRINLAPLRYGAGLKGKVFDGFLTGTPTVMTPIAAEGICSQEEWVHSEVDALVADAVELYENLAAWQLRQARERALCEARFSAAHWQPQLMQSIRTAIDERDRRRQQNFIGQMLHHHQHRSTEFMSRWIEAKNA